MGASPFHVFGAGADFDAAFRQAHEQSGFEEGYSYSGTLSCKPGAVIAGRTPLPMRAATLRADELMNWETGDARAVDKWGPALALPVTEAAPRTRTRRISLRSAERDSWQIHDAIRAAVELAPDEAIDLIDLDPVPPLAYTVSARTSAGESVTRYRIIGYDGDYPSQAEARRALVALLKDPNCRADTLGIEAVRRRADGAPLVVAERTPRPRTVRATVTIISPRPDAPISGWLFFGYAPS